MHRSHIYSFSHATAFPAALQILAYADKMAGLMREHAALRRSQAMKDFRADVAHSTAIALGAR